MNSKIFVSYDQFDAMAVAVTNDSFIQPNSRGVRRMVRFLSYIDRTTLTHRFLLRSVIPRLLG
jgi:hypothetical protein